MTLSMLFFYKTPIGLRFALCDEIPSLDTFKKECITRLKEIYIYTRGIKHPDILVIKLRSHRGYEEVYNDLRVLLKRIGLPKPVEESKVNRKSKYEDETDEDRIYEITYYWDLTVCKHNINRLFKELIRTDVGALNLSITSGIYILDTVNHVILYPYCSEGSDIISTTKEPLLPLYIELMPWLLGYDMDIMSKVFK